MKSMKSVLKINQRRINKKIILIVLLIPGAVILITEIFLRISCKQKLSKWQCMQYILDPILGYRYYPDTTFVFSNNAFSNECRTNSFGFPGENFSMDKKFDIYRIMIVGTSDETGFCSDGPHSHASLLNDLFTNNKYPIEVINCSTDGQRRTLRNIELIKNECFQYQPDLILLRNEILPFEDGYITNNEIKLNDSIIFVKNNARDSTLSSIGFINFNLSQIDKSVEKCFLKLYLSELNIGSDFIKDHKYTMDETAKMYKDLQTFLHQNQIQFFLYDTYETPKKYDKSFQRRDINYFSLNIPSRKEYSFGVLDGHSTQLGNRIVADSLLKKLTSTIIPEQYLTSSITKE